MTPSKISFVKPKPYNGSDAQERVEALLGGPQRYTCLAGGTRAGKTFLIVRAILGRAANAPGSRHAILRFHANAARRTIAQDTLPKVRQLCFPGVDLDPSQGGGLFTLKNKSRITVDGLDGAARVEKVLGSEFASVFLNEASQIPYESALIAFTRLAQNVPDLAQRAYVDLNPTSKTHWTNVLFGEKRDPLTRLPLTNPENYVRAFLNPLDNAENLTPEFLADLERLPERQRKRFYEGVYIDDVDDALWTYELIEKNRAGPEMIPLDQRKIVVVGVDPAGSAHKNSDATGIIVAALDQIGDAYVLADLSCRADPLSWARRVVHAFHEHKDRQQVRLAARASDTIGGVPFLVALARGVFDGCTVQRERAFLTAWTAPPLGSVILFKGRIATIDEIGRTSALVTVASDLVLLDIDMPRNFYQTHCVHTLYDSGCGLTKAAFGADGTVGAGSTTSVIAWTDAAAVHTQGTILFTSGANAGVQATIKSAAPGTSLTLTYPLTTAPAAGDSFTAYQGCDHRLSTCRSQFANAANFRGFPFTPPPTSAY